MGPLSNGLGGRLEQLLDLNNPEHRALLEDAAKRIYSRFNKLAEQAAETDKDYLQRIYLSVVEEPLPLVNKEIYSRAWKEFFRAPSKYPFCNSRGRALTVRYVYERRAEPDALSCVPLEPYHISSNPEEETSELDKHLDAADEALVEIMNDPKASNSLKAAARATFNGEPLARAATYYNISRQAAEQGNKALVSRLKKKLTKEPTA